MTYHVSNPTLHILLSSIFWIAIIYVFFKYLYHVIIKRLPVSDSERLCDMIDEIIEERYNGYVGQHLKPLKAYHEFIRDRVGDGEFLDTLLNWELDNPKPRFVLPDEYEMDDFPSPKIWICPICDRHTLLYTYSRSIVFVYDYCCLNPLCKNDNIELSDIESANPDFDALRENG